MSRSGGAKYWVMMGHSDESEKRRNYVMIPGSKEQYNKLTNNEVLISDRAYPANDN